MQQADLQSLRAKFEAFEARSEERLGYSEEQALFARGVGGRLQHLEGLTAQATCGCDLLMDNELK